VLPDNSHHGAACVRSRQVGTPTPHREGRVFDRRRATVTGTVMCVPLPCEHSSKNSGWLQQPVQAQGAAQKHVRLKQSVLYTMASQRARHARFLPKCPGGTPHAAAQLAVQRERGRPRARFGGNHAAVQPLSANSPSYPLIHHDHVADRHADNEDEAVRPAQNKVGVCSHTADGAAGGAACKLPPECPGGTPGSCVGSGPEVAPGHTSKRTCCR